MPSFGVSPEEQQDVLKTSLYWKFQYGRGDGEQQLPYWLTFIPMHNSITGKTLGEVTIIPLFNTYQEAYHVLECGLFARQMLFWETAVPCAMSICHNLCSIIKDLEQSLHLLLK